MLVHYNLYPSTTLKGKNLIIAVFYFDYCTPEDMLLKTREMINSLDSSIGKVFYTDWMWELEQGVTKIESTCDLETITDICNSILEKIKQ